MADDRGRGLPPPRDVRDDNTYLPGANIEDDDRSRPYQPRMAPVSLPPIQDHAGGPPPGPYGHPPHGRYPPPAAPMDPRDPRAPPNFGPSPAAANGYQPPSASHGPQYLPSVDPRASQYPPPPPGPPSDAYGRQPPPPGPYPAPGSYDYSRMPAQGPPPGYPPDMRPGFAPMPAPAQHQAGAPRQRTSIACKYCRRRKIRCSGYWQGGKCSNCVKMNQDCIFQPVSSSNSTAFVPITAVQGAIAPGTPLYGAYGQPLPPVAPGQQPPPLPPGAQYPPGTEYAPVQSPTTPYPQGSFEPDRRRPREEDQPPPRLPPPNPGYQDQDPRRRSPATSSTNSPGGPTYSSYPPPAGYEAGGSTPTQRGSPGGTPGQPSAGGGGVMSLGNIMDGPTRNESIDRNMLNRLGRPSR